MYSIIIRAVLPGSFGDENVEDSSYSLPQITRLVKGWAQVRDILSGVSKPLRAPEGRRGDWGPRLSVQ